MSVPFAIAEDVTIRGERGANGAPGGPGLPGGDGEDGESVFLVVDQPFQDNSAIGFAGAGGTGGRGGDAATGSGANGGDGGRGGSGGNANVVVSTEFADVLEAQAFGGGGGNPGAGGVGSARGVDGEFGGFGPPAGNARAEGSITQTYDGSQTAGGVRARVVAGGGGNPLNGGDADAIVLGEILGAGAEGLFHNISAFAVGAGFAVSGGDATANATGSTTGGTLSVSAEAKGGFGFVHLGEGSAGESTAVASGQHSGAGQLNVTAIATPAEFFGSEDFREYGAATARASGMATGGADVNVRAILLGGRDSLLRDAVSGSTSGRLSLFQTQRGDLSFESSINGPSGVTRSGLVAENPGGGDLEIDVRVDTRSRRSASSGSGQDGEVILGDVIGRSTNASNVGVSVEVAGVNIRQEKLDDPSRRSEILGVSNGGDVRVESRFTALPRRGWVIDDVPVGALHLTSGPSISMGSTVDGETSGRLELVQSATASGGFGTNLPASELPDSIRFQGDGGEATSRLSKSGSFASLVLRATSTGGNGAASTRDSSLLIGGNGGVSRSELNGRNDAGSIQLEAESVGGVARSSAVQTGDGGDAFVDIEGKTMGDGQAILIGRSDYSSASSSGGARGGESWSAGSSSFNPSPPSRTDGRGGQAQSQSKGIALGDSEVAVYDLAIGGLAGRRIFSGIDPGRLGARGGDARSRSSGVGGGDSQVIASALAIGGGGSQNVAMGGAGGDADAFAEATGSGAVRSDALAIGGEVSLPGTLAGSAKASSYVSGSLGIATAEARTGLGSGAAYSVRVTRETSTSTRVSAEATFGSKIPYSSPKNPNTAFLTGSPVATDVASARGFHRELDSYLSEDPAAFVESIGQWRSRGSQEGLETQRVELDITLAPPDGESDLIMAVFLRDAASGGFETLMFQLEVFGEAYGDEVVFENLVEAKAYFSSLMFLGRAFLDDFANDGDPAVRAIFDVTAGRGQFVSFGLAVVVPEPSTVLLVGIGLAVLATRRHRSSCKSF